MKINIEDYLHQIDAYFKDKSQKDTYMTYAMVVGIVFAFAYFLFWDSSFEEFESTRSKVVVLERNLNTDKRYLQQNPESKITRLDQEINTLNDTMTMHKDNNAYIKSKIETISALIYDERSWGEYLDSISTSAQRNHIKILQLSNKYADNNNSFGHILDISVKVTGNYKNTLRFINSLEQSELVIDIHSLNIDATKSLTSDLEISVWGITY